MDEPPNDSKPPTSDPGPIVGWIAPSPHPRTRPEKFGLLIAAVAVMVLFGTVVVGCVIGYYGLDRDASRTEHRADALRQAGHAETVFVST
jgi:hypothetical protein